MDCASCASVTEKALKGAKGIKSIGISYMTDTAYVEFDPNEVNGDSIKRAIKKAGYDSIIEKVIMAVA